MRRAAFVASILMTVCGWTVAQPSAPSSTAAEQVQVWQLTHGELAPSQRLVAVLKGDRLRWRISSDSAGELHLHGYRLSVHVQPGQTVELAFTAHATGRFPVEWHPAGDPAAPSTHHAAPLAVLEVRPP